MPILKSFGVYSAVGVFFAFITLVVMVPLILVTSRGRIKGPSEKARRSPIDLFLAACARLVLERTRLCVLGAALTGALFAFFGGQVIVDNSLAGMLEDEHPVTRAGALVDEKLAGLVSLEVDLRGAAGAFDDPALLGELLALERRLARHPDVRVVQGPAALVLRTHEALTGEPGLPSSRVLSAQLSFLQDGSGFYDGFLSEGRSRGRVVVRTADLGGRRFAALEQELGTILEAWLQGEAARAQQVRATLTGTTALSYGGVNRLAEDLRLAVLSAFLIVLGLILFIFRSVRIALITVVPNSLPLVCGYGLMGLMGWPLEPGPAVVFTVALGIAVDDTIHILSRAAEASEEHGKSHIDAVREAILNTGRPVVITSIILSAGFAINMLSAFPNNARVGALGAFVILVALVADLFLLPALLVLFGKGAFKGRARSL
jgi:predicted RND superfamily exporter protein